MKSLVQDTATVILSGFVSYHTQFKSITRRAADCFVTRNWEKGRANALQRLDLYSEIVDRTLTDVQRLLEERTENRELWQQVKADFEQLIREREDLPLAETFFNSITRRIFITVGVDPEIEFIHADVLPIPLPGRAFSPITRAYVLTQFGSLIDLISVILKDFALEAPFIHVELDAAQVAARVKEATGSRVERIDMVRGAFFRGKAAYLVGRILTINGILPLVIALQHGADGLYVDAVIIDEDEMSIVFSFAHAYFLVEIDQPHRLIAFLKSLLPRKPVSDLWISIGYNRHGKTVLYRELLHHLASSSDRFEFAPGTPGMVMLVFTLPSFEMVFKIIKDKFDYPKQSTRKDVMASYRLVFRHDRAGRLLDAQSFEFLEFDLDRFQPEVLETLQREASESITIHDDKVVLNFLYTERRVTPLNLYLANASDAEQQAAVDEYGQAIRDLAATNIFPGDLFLKNFGVTRHGRVLFYDYDELCFVTDCNFRDIPPAPTWEDELSDQPWYAVAPHDVFPEQFVHFLGLKPPLKKRFLAEFSDLLTAAYWQHLQHQHKAGHLPQIYPYTAERRLANQTADS